MGALSVYYHVSTIIKGLQVVGDSAANDVLAGERFPAIHIGERVGAHLVTYQLDRERLTCAGVPCAVGVHLVEVLDAHRWSFLLVISYCLNNTGCVSVCIVS